MTLFDLPPLPAPEPRAALSATQRLTLRNRALLARGVHPATRIGLRAEGGTCGECAHCDRQRYHDRTYIKCDLIPVTHGPGADIRASWPACTKWEAA